MSAISVINPVLGAVLAVTSSATASVPYESISSVLITLILAIMFYFMVRIVAEALKTWALVRARELQTREGRSGPLDVAVAMNRMHVLSSELRSSAVDSAALIRTSTGSAIGTVDPGALKISKMLIKPDAQLSDAQKTICDFASSAFSAMLGSHWRLLKALESRPLVTYAHAYVYHDESVLRGCSLSFTDWIDYLDRFELIDRARNVSVTAGPHGIQETTYLTLTDLGEWFMAWCVKESKDDRRLAAEGRDA